MNKYVITEAQFASIKESITIDEVRLPDFILASIKGYKTSLGNHPAFPPDDESKFEEKILKKRYYELLSNVKKVDGAKGDITKKNLIEILKNLTIKCKQIESPIKDKLEKICFDFVIETFQIDPTQLNIECAITDNIEPKAPLTPKKMTDEFEDIKHVETLNDEIIKRRLINALIQGASVRISNDVYESALNKIYSLDHRLPELYHDILCINEFLSFIKEQKPSNENLAGEATVNISSESPSIKSEGIIFPILIFETIKGVMELLSSHGLPEIKTDAEYVIAKADFRLAENWDKRLGVGLWDILMNTIGYDNYSTIPYVFVELISLPLPDFQQSMREIFGLTKKGRKLIKDIIHNIERNKSFNEIEASANNSDEFFTPEELIGEVIGETDTFSAGDYTYDVPAFVDSETADHKNMISKSIEDGMNEQKDYYDFYDNISTGTYDILTEFLHDKKHGVSKKSWNLIPKQQYHNALKEFMQYGSFMRFPVRYIDDWSDIIMNNVVAINAITDLAGHSTYFPFDDFLDAIGIQDNSPKYSKLYGNYNGCSEILDQLGFYDWASLPDGSDGWSDYALGPLFNLIKELEDNDKPEEKIVTINKILDVIHQRGDLASAFIEGGRKSLSDISNN